MQIYPATVINALVFAETQLEMDCLCRQIRGGAAWDAGDALPVALYGIYGQSGGTLEAWFACRPAAAKYLRPLVRFMRARLTEVQPASVRCSVRPGHAPGERLARLLGFEGAKEIVNAPGTPVHGVQFWRYQPWAN